MLRKKLSVVIPYYNNLPGLKRLLSTIPTTELDIIVVDDNSDDNKNALILADEFPDVEFIKNDSKSSNAGSARNVGLSRVTSQYVMFADSDDYFCNGAFNKLSYYLGRSFDCAYFLTDAKSEFIDNRPERNVFYNDLVYRFNKGDETIRYEFVVPWSKIINMDLIRKYNIKFDEVSVSNDMMFSLLVGIYSEHILAVEEKIYCVVKNGSGISTDLTKTKSKCRLDVNMRCNLLMLNNNVPPKHLFSTKGVFIRSRLSIFNPEERILFFKYVKYLKSLALAEL